jgi:hypothetical protein
VEPEGLRRKELLIYYCNFSADWLGRDRETKGPWKSGYFPASTR